MEATRLWELRKMGRYQVQWNESYSVWVTDGTSRFLWRAKRLACRMARGSESPWRVFDSLARRPLFLAEPYLSRNAERNILRDHVYEFLLREHGDPCEQHDSCKACRVWSAFDGVFNPPDDEPGDAPCPFCGSREVTVTERPYESYATCSRCWAQGPCVERSREAMEWWNNRINVTTERSSNER